MNPPNENPVCAGCPQCYPDVDFEIRGLVAALNRIPGIHTVSSCGGHRERDAQVMFQAVNQSSIYELASRLPFLGTESGYFNGHPVQRSIILLVHGVQAQKVLCQIWVGGQPEFVRRELIADVETAISSVLI